MNHVFEDGVGVGGRGLVPPKYSILSEQAKVRKLYLTSQLKWITKLDNSIGWLEASTLSDQETEWGYVQKEITSQTDK